MLLTAQEHSFQFFAIAGQYNASATMLAYRNRECVVSYATADGYDNRNVGQNYQNTFDFTEGFETRWYQ
jgi:hypothetical protein